jgi:hypothetical protein
MKKIINGKHYDTDKAERLAEHTFANPSDFRYVSEELYRTPNGAFFLHGEGGGLSKYRVAVDTNSWTGGSTIVPLTKEAANAWLEEHGETKVLEKYFPNIIADA